MEAKKQQSHSWWFDSHKNPTHSPWLVNTLAELDAKIKVMLKLMEGDADSFAKRVEVYYKKRPELMIMVEDLYRSHRSLIERYAQLRTRNLSDQISISSYESEVVDYEEEFKAEDEVKESSDTEQERSNALVMMKEEVERLKEENKKLRDELEVKNEEMREFVRDFSLISQTNFLGFFDFKKLKEGIPLFKFFGRHF